MYVYLCALQVATPDGGELPPPCVGDFSPVRPREDADVLRRVCHVPVPAGAAVFWDYRTPHANAARNASDRPREVIYTGFLPDTAWNRAYAHQQLDRLLRGIPPDDQWMALSPVIADAGCENGAASGARGALSEYEWSALGRRLVGLSEW
ncbi:unnamed protein product [Phaeothamnion confervicola]